MSGNLAICAGVSLKQAPRIHERLADGIPSNRLLPLGVSQTPGKLDCVQFFMNTSRKASKAFDGRVIIGVPESTMQCLFHQREINSQYT